MEGMVWHGGDSKMVDFILDSRDRSRWGDEDDADDVVLTGA